MKRILIVEDNKTLANLLYERISQTLNYEVDIAYKLSEAKLFLKRYEYFIAILDINLPDAPDGEIVDYTISKKNHIIVLTSNTDREFRKMMLQKNIIDYVSKNGVDYQGYILQTITRLDKNQAHKILVVDDSMVFRKTMKTMLENLFFQVITVAHGEEALGMLELHVDISLVVTDYNMPVMDGLELTREIRQKYSKSEICIIAISSDSDDETNSLFLKQGANDYINKPFSKEEFSCRINNSIEALENIQLVTNHANRDFLTGLYNRRYFFKNMEAYTKDIVNSSENYSVAMIDIDLFKNINDTYGHETGDNIIVHLSELLRTSTSHKDLVSRFGGEEFCIVLKNIDRATTQTILQRIRVAVESATYITQKDEVIKFTISIGVAFSSEDSIEDIINQADMMLYNAKQNGRNQVVG